MVSTIITSVFIYILSITSQKSKKNRTIYNRLGRKFKELVVITPNKETFQKSVLRITYDLNRKKGNAFTLRQSPYEKNYASVYSFNSM